MKEFYIKTYKIAPIILLLFSLLYNNSNILSLIIGLIIIGFGELLRIKNLKSDNYPKIYLGNSLIYLGLSVMSNALFPYFQILVAVYYYFYWRSNFYLNIEKIQNHNSDKILYSDVHTIKSWGFVALTFVLIWGIRRL